MKKAITILSIILLFLSLLVLPVFDYLIDQDNLTVGSGPNVVIRAIVAIIMLCFPLIPERGHIKRCKSRITTCVFFLVAYMAFITLLLSPATTNPIYNLVQVEYPLLGFLCFYYLTKYSFVDERIYSYFFLILIPIIAVTAYLNLDSRMDSETGLELADNTGYALVCAYAGIMFLAKKKTFPIVLFLVIVGVLISGKRGAIIAMLFATIPLLVYVFIDSKVKISKQLVFIILAAIGTFVALRYFNSYFDAAFERFENLEEDEGSGRGWVYLDYWNQFKDSREIHQFFGHGLFAGSWSSGSKYAFTDVYAHNDWLELLFDFGIVSVMTYVIIFLWMLIVIFLNIRNRTVYFYMLCMSFVIWLVKSILSSTFLMDANSVYLYMTTAFAMAKLEQERTGNKQTISSKAV